MTYYHWLTDELYCEDMITSYYFKKSVIHINFSKQVVIKRTWVIEVLCAWRVLTDAMHNGALNIKLIILYKIFFSILWHISMSDKNKTINIVALIATISAVSPPLLPRETVTSNTKEAGLYIMLDNSYTRSHRHVFFMQDFDLTDLWLNLTCPAICLIRNCTTEKRDERIFNSWEMKNSSQALAWLLTDQSTGLSQCLTGLGPSLLSNPSAVMLREKKESHAMWAALFTGTEWKKRARWGRASERERNGERERRGIHMKERVRKERDRERENRERKIKKQRQKREVEKE